ncbi:unnamed protein product [Didymodactylos carnosus]|uniref:Mab-21-like HhH/H2TH-like domain-containing protein n=1 Tax=Didymodactylos carnosus TaxID=1234261 RepID=A0A814BJB1_9BILA|nr:unnamed protein product [Didymodactylos carnosus]CAF3706661.1 unnamed protein product [Didymodactylos carnosus]
MYPAYVSGSIAEGQLFSQDIDFIFEEGELNSENEFIPTDNDLYVQIKWNSEKLAHLPYGYNDGLCCVNGFKMKQNYCNIDPNILRFLQANMDVSVDKPNILRSPLIKNTAPEEFMQTFKQGLKVIESQSKTKYKKNFFTLHAELNKCRTNMIERERMMDNIPTSNLIENVFHFMGPAYGVYFSAERRKFLMQVMEKISSYNSDIVLALKLNFWPNNVQPFLKRFQLSNQPIKLYEKIRLTHIHVVPKSSKISTTAEYEFRYSFSAIERLLAQSRTSKQRILNGIARSIYYKYLQPQTSLQSYLIKTIVLWMCEMEDDFSYGNVDNQYEENEIIGTQWITYTCNILRSRTCKHYFIDHVNILETYTTETLEEACKILENVDLFEINQTSLQRTTYDVATNSWEDIKQWIGQLNLKDVLSAINDFTELTLRVFPHASNERDAIFEIIIVLNTLNLLDGDQEENNLSIWKRLFLDTDNDEREDENIDNRLSEWSMLHPLHITDGLSLAAVFITWINDIVTSPSILNSIKNLNFDFIIRLWYITNKTKIFKMNKGELINLFLPNDVNPYYQQTPTSPSIIDDSHANGGTQLTDLIKKMYETSTIPPSIISAISLLSAGDKDNAAVTINDLYQLGKLSDIRVKRICDDNDCIDAQLLQHAINESLTHQQDNE